MQALIRSFKKREVSQMALSDTERKMLLDAVQKRLEKLFATSSKLQARESAKADEIKKIDDKFDDIKDLKTRLTSLQRELGELLVPNFDDLTEGDRKALITLADGYSVKRTHPESLEISGELAKVIEAIELALISHASDHSIDEFVTYPDPEILKETLKKRENRYLIDEVPGLKLVYSINLIYGHNQDKTITDKNVDRYLPANHLTPQKQD